MFGKLLIANRGEIAVRIIRTARHLGLRTVAVYSDADRDAMHVDAADEAYRIGPAPARESYLRAETILEAARRSGADAVHPGYGFLAENAAFAQGCLDAGLVFVGPPPAAIRIMGSKSEAKRRMEAALVPVIPGYFGADQTVERLRAEAEAIGYPVLVKAALGGGGRGMRIVHHATELDEALAAARREAESAFGDGELLLERYLERPHHIEVQVFADSQGNAVSLFERDCSVQRRHQKVIEEAPAPGLPESTRARLAHGAVAAARAIDYVGAGTVEFIVDAEGAFWFMEMNTRLQVEHPVTEMITGLDLVEWQLRVAAGEPLPLAQDAIVARGHALEARLYAEDPQRDFLPSPGRILHLRLPAESAHVRVDRGVREGDVVGAHYDPLIAKLIVWDEDRPRALRRLLAALREAQVAGVATNLAFLAAVASHPDFARGADTGFVERHRADLMPEAAPATDEVLAAAALWELTGIDRAAAQEAAASRDPHSPWHCRDGWRLNADNHHRLIFLDGARRVEVTAHYRRGYYLLELPGATARARAELEPNGDLLADLDGIRRRATVVRSGAELTVIVDGHCHRLTLVDPLVQAMARESPARGLTAPMPGTVTAVTAVAGQRVERGDALLTLEAMKMEHTVRAPAAGLVVGLRCALGDTVAEGVELVEFEAEE
ncbi:MAG TPA: acetyl/propionyl/methylcrotonyl-CoA carboxylase subunit alpha [Pelomicrobium sp.]|nr:acetyl/propionyl/methylcrotonyl-CoA carboxylase subunit alpha [Pelomicrobium sp.]